MTRVPPTDLDWCAYHVRTARYRARTRDPRALDMAIVRAVESLLQSARGAA